MSDHHSHFPKELPLEDIKVVIGFLRNDGTSARHALDCALWVLGCAAQLLPEAIPVPMHSSGDEAGAQALESAIAVKGGVGAFPWATVLSVMWPLAQRLLREWLVK